MIAIAIASDQSWNTTQIGAEDVHVANEQQMFKGFRIPGEKIHDAAIDGRISIVLAELRKDPSSIHARDRVGRTALYCAAQHDYAALVELLLDSGADINARRSANSTPLLVAALPDVST